MKSKNDENKVSQDPGSWGKRDRARCFENSKERRSLFDIAKRKLKEGRNGSSSSAHKGKAERRERRWGAVVNKGAEEEGSSRCRVSAKGRILRRADGRMS